jgi:transposase
MRLAPAMPDSKRSKRDALIEEGAFNPTPDKVRDPKFRAEEFFDPRDAVQVKYEMLRRVSVDKLSITEAADEYGVSRPTYYQAKTNFDAAGIAGLVQAKPGPRGPHKLDDDIMAFLRARLVPGEPVRARELARLVRNELQIELHPRTIERALKKRAGKRHRDLGRLDPAVGSCVQVRGVANRSSRRSAAAHGS